MLGDINILFIMVLIAGALAALAVSVGKFRKYLFLKSTAYKQNLDALLTFSHKIRNNVARQDILGDDVILEIVESGREAVTFFQHAPFRLDEKITEIVMLHEKAEELLRRHDAEVRLRHDFAAPISLMLGEDRFIPYSKWHDISEAGMELAATLKSGELVLPSSKETIHYVATFSEMVAQHNREFVERESARLSGFFDSLAGYPLDSQQKECCIVDEDAGIVIAGAGSGKTSVIMAKVAYLVKIRHVPPENILLISFTNKAANEMSERISGCLGESKVSASTFHKFGLEVIKCFAKDRYDIADETFLKRAIHKALTGNDDYAPELYESAVDFFAYHFNADDGDDSKYETFADKIEHDKCQDLHTLKSLITGIGENITLGGEQVKSAEEVLIANFLFLNGIEYVYEKLYDKPYDDDGQHRAYHPDFYLPEYDVYIEHYGIDELGNPPHFFSPVEQQKYKTGIEWKRSLHAAAKNKYIESYSWWVIKGVIFENLKSELLKNGVVFRPRDRHEVLKLLREKAGNKFDDTENLLATFITLFKSNGYDVPKFDEMLQEETNTKKATLRQRSFLRLAKSLFIRYERELSNENVFDFSDMINKATAIVDKLPKHTLGFSYVIVDEYQDASMSRMKLIKAIIGNTGAHLFCVGDDWQSIYRFAGSDISLFTHFSEYVGHAAVMRIENTYRNSQELIDIMGRFVMMNPRQIPKALRSGRNCASPIEIVTYDGDEGKQVALRDIARRIYKLVNGQEVTVLLLGRTKYDNKVLRESQLFVPDGGVGRYKIPQAPNLKFEFLTVHKSKGLEGDYVVLLNADSGSLGFPNMVADDPILQLVLGKAEDYEFAEERRLFYVALTRTRNKSYVLVPRNRYSSFIDDLCGIGVECKNMKSAETNAQLVACPKCGKGHLVGRRGTHGMFSGCSNYPQCDYTVNFTVTPDTPRCPACGGFLAKRYMKTRRVPFWGCTNYPHCGYTTNQNP